ncbi:MAG: helix-turn-helix domain-containing protein [Hyphomicrobium zavarzinii]|jgi:hypothetical protein|uniref:helix-turn-helix domain-containing protein n=1 Tax=Hyphomicrobium zavarzinii TaxID=48292 RepID=UPI001A454A0D|nr:helix-turn-helix domain-containing protein [Hyphomicrobium zavarzinii]
MMPQADINHPPQQRDWLTVPEAAAIAEISERCIRNWCLDHGIGIKVRGRWRVSRASLNLILAGDR